MRVHLDTDLGGDPDDLCALALLLKWPGVELTGITTVAEAQGRRAGYTKYALWLAGRSEIPVAAGADCASYPYRQAMGFPDESDYWPEPIPPAPTPVTEALTLLKRSIEAGARIVAIGPYTNLALFDQAYPGLLPQAPLYLMGGQVYPMRPGFPQWGRDQDFNVQVDVASARYVLERCRPTLTPLEITLQTALRRVSLPRLCDSGPLGALLARQAEAHDREWHNEATYGRTCPGLPDDILNFHHDALTCAVALGWDGVTVQELPLRLDLREGWLHTRVEHAGRPVSVVTGVDGHRFNAFWSDLICS